LIAPQVGLIDQSQLLAAFQCRAREKDWSLADHLAARGDIDTDGRAAVEAMLSLHPQEAWRDVEKSLPELPAGRSNSESLVDQFPAVTWDRRNRGEALIAQGGLRAATGRHAPAEKDLTEDRALFEEMAAKEPENRSYPGDIGRLELALGRLRLGQSPAEETRKHLDDAVARLECCSQRPYHVRERASLDEARKARAEANAARSEGQGRSAGP
jgi:hypothetical protein